MTTRALQIECLLDPIIDYRTNSIASGYTAYFYSAGTSNAKNVWTEKEKTNPYTSRTLSSDGTVQVYGDGVYKIVIKDTDGTTLYTWDNIKIQANTFTVQNKSDTYTATADDDLVLADGTFTVNLATVTGFTHPIIIKRISGTVTVDPYGDETIGSDSTISLTSSDDSATLYPDVVSGTWTRADRLSGLTATVSELNAAADYVGNLTASEAEVNLVCDGNTASAAELSTLAGQGVTAGDFSKLAALTASDAEINVLDGVTATTAELNVLDGITATTAEINKSAFLNYIGPVHRRSLFTYNGGATAYTIKASGGYYNVNGKVAQWTTELTTTAISSPLANTWYYLYLDYSGITSETAITNTELIWSSTAPSSYDAEYSGWFNGDDLCIYAVLTNGTPNNILEFLYINGLTIWADSMTSRSYGTPGTTNWTDVTLDMPGFCKEGLVTLAIGYHGTSNGNSWWRTNGQTGTAGHIIGYTSSTEQDPKYYQAIVISDASQIIEVAEHAANSVRIGVYTDGWYLPEGM